jgi:hypothetical protein
MNTGWNIVGHESQAISQHYTHLDIDTIRRRSSKPPVLKLVEPYAAIQPDLRHQHLSKAKRILGIRSGLVNM